MITKQELINILSENTDETQEEINQTVDKILSEVKKNMDGYIELQDRRGKIDTLRPKPQPVEEE